MDYCISLRRRKTAFAPVLEPWLIGEMSMLAALPLLVCSAKPTIGHHGSSESPRSVSCSHAVAVRRVMFTSLTKLEQMLCFASLPPSGYPSFLYLVPYNSLLWLAALAFQRHLADKDKNTSSAHANLKLSWRVIQV